MVHDGLQISMLNMRFLVFLLVVMLVSASSTTASAYVLNDNNKKLLKDPDLSKTSSRQIGNQFAEISGRVVTSDGQGIRNTVVFLVGKDGIRYGLSGSMGFFSISNVPAGENYSLHVAHPRFIFAYPAEIIKIHSDIRDLLVVGELNLLSDRK